MSAARSAGSDPAMRKLALIVGVLYVITFLTSIPALPLYNTVVTDPEFVLGQGAVMPVMWGGILEIVLAITGIGSAVVLYPVVKRQSLIAATGVVTARVIESAMILVGVLSLWTIVTLRQDAAGAADPATLVVAGQSLVALHDWTFLFGPGIAPAINGLFLGYVMYRSRLVPRILPVLGLIGAPLLLVSTTLAIFGAIEQMSPVALVLVLPIAVWEFGFGLWLIFKGFNPASPVFTGAPASEPLVAAAG